ncbi:hypothetical protein, partial [Pseudomonas sp. efr-133-TYG-5]|uniref:hypothetical protein n=1 Tax=Pseudomonas sp. efr-133-TYG-5 TaxID=3040310 RepID=UPI0025533D7D
PKPQLRKQLGFCFARRKVAQLDFYATARCMAIRFARVCLTATGEPTSSETYGIAGIQSSPEQPLKEFLLK